MSINYEELERKRNLEVYVDNLSNEDVFAAFNDVFDIKAKFQDVKFSWDGDFKFPIYVMEVTTSENVLSNGCYIMMFNLSERKVTFNFFRNQKYLETEYEPTKSKESQWHFTKVAILLDRKRRGLIK